MDPLHGVFVKERVKAVSELPQYEMRVLAPIPWFPRLGAFGKRFPHWHRWSSFPDKEVVEGLSVEHPRYVLPPKLGGYVHPWLMYPSLKRAADRLHKEFPFDLIDAHWVYPYGVAAARLARAFQVPIVMTGRGQDMHCATFEPLARRGINWALREGNGFIGVSRGIAAAMNEQGACGERTFVIPNGVDGAKFFMKPQLECRRKLSLPQNRKLILSVGSRIELKGFHLLVEALPRIQAVQPNAMLVIVGDAGRHGRDYTSQIRLRVKDLKLEDSVLLAGPQPHNELVDWYNAADVFALMSSREGSSNALLEALACGVPAVATPVGGMIDELSDNALGVLLPSRDSRAAAVAVTRLLDAPLDREEISGRMRKRRWQETALEVDAVFQQAISDYRRPPIG